MLTSSGWMVHGHGSWRFAGVFEREWAGLHDWRISNFLLEIPRAYTCFLSAPSPYYPCNAWAFFFPFASWEFWEGRLSFTLGWGSPAFRWWHKARFCSAFLLFYGAIRIFIARDLLVGRLMYFFFLSFYSDVSCEFYSMWILFSLTAFFFLSALFFSSNLMLGAIRAHTRYEYT